MIRERVLAGLARARVQGKVLGRPKLGHEPDPKVRDARRKVEQAIRADLAAGRGIVRVARDHTVGVALVQRLKAEMST